MESRKHLLVTAHFGANKQTNKQINAQNESRSSKIGHITTCRSTIADPPIRHPFTFNEPNEQPHKSSFEEPTNVESLSRSLNKNTATPIKKNPSGGARPINLLDYDHWEINLPHHLLSSFCLPAFYGSCCVGLVVSVAVSVSAGGKYWNPARRTRFPARN